MLFWLFASKRTKTHYPITMFCISTTVTNSHVPCSLKLWEEYPVTFQIRVLVFK